MILPTLAAVLAAGAMGFAIQRGGTCTVAAVDEVLTRRRAGRLAAMLEASLWVAGGLAIAQLLHVTGSMPANHAVSGWTIAGGVLLGLGAWVNGACVFGAIARLGSGQWAYALTPVGFFVGCVSAAALFGRPAPVAADAPLNLPAAVLAPLFAIYAAWRLMPALWHTRRERGTLRMKVWAPHAATIVIGITFVITLLAVGRWAYTDVLADLATGATATLGIGLLLLVALFAGALLGGWTAGRWRPIAPATAQLARCMTGGALMAWGSLLIPGSNDALILIGIPLLLPYAWFAFAAMCVTIAAGLGAQRVWLAHLHSATD